MTDLRDQHATIDHLTKIARELVTRVRDEGPDDNATWLTRKLPVAGDWFRLAFVLAAAIPDDRTWTELTAWTRPEPLTPETPAPVAIPIKPIRITNRDVKPCGTLAAVSRHRYRREPLCDLCRDTARAYDRERHRARRNRRTT